MAVSAQSVDHSKPVLEPYELPGGIIVFTNWYFIRPGHFDWVDSEGNSVYASSNAKLDENEATFVPLDSPLGIKLFVEPAISEIPVIESDKPWDKGGIRPVTLLHEEGKFRLWGTCNSEITSSSNASSSGTYVCYFESSDGINWIKPNLGFVEFNGTSDNNLLKKGSAANIFIDPSAPPEERYKSLSSGKISSDEFEKYRDTREWSVMATELDAPDVHVMRGSVSPDGFNWTTFPDPIAFEHFDTQNTGYYDINLKKYVLYVRTFMLGPRAPGYPYPREKFHQYMWRRAIGRIESDGFRQLPLSNIIIEPAPDMNPADQFYTNCYTTIPGAPELHLMFPAIYNVNDDETDIAVYSSYNGKTWHKLPGQPVYETQDFGKPDGGCVFAHPNLVERPNGDWILPYTGYNVPHKYPRGSYRFEPGMLVWPAGRLAGVQAEEKGEFATVAFVVPGETLKINALTQRAGYIKIEVVGMDGYPLKEHTFEDVNPVIGNHYKTVVSWKNSNKIGVKKGIPVFLRFKMKMAKIYGLYFE